MGFRYFKSSGRNPKPLPAKSVGVSVVNDPASIALLARVAPIDVDGCRHDELATGIGEKLEFKAGSEIVEPLSGWPARLLQVDPRFLERDAGRLGNSLREFA